MTQTTQSQVKTIINQIAASHAQAVLKPQVDVNTLVGERLKGATVGVKMVIDDANTGSLLDQNSKLLKMKYDSLVNAGFTKDEAFKIILTDLSRSG